MAKKHGTWDKLKRKVKEARIKEANEEALTYAETEALSNWKAIRKGWKNLVPDNRREAVHTGKSRQQMSESRKRLWQNREFREKMWRARRARQFREKGKCLLRFPRLGVSSTEKEWLDAYRKRYHRITGKRLVKSAIVYYPHKPEPWAANHPTIS
jgi:hypothetical protein